MTGERLAAAVLEQQNRLAHCPIDFVQCRRPRLGEGRRLFPAGSAEMGRALFKGSGRDEWSAAAGTERLRDGPNLTPAAAANEGAAGGVQRLVTDSAWGGKNKMKKGCQ
jgi:hypothetical protein